MSDSELNKRNNMLEKEIERKVCKYAQSKGFLTYKFTSPGRRSVPDRLMIAPKGYSFFVEFKRFGLKPTPQQYREIERLQSHNQVTFVVDSVEKGTALIDEISRLLK